MLKCLEIWKPSILGLQNRRRSSWYIYRIYVTYTTYRLYTGYRLVKPLITRYKIHPRPRYNIKQFLGFRNIFEKRRTYHLISSHILQIKDYFPFEMVAFQGTFVHFQGTYTFQYFPECFQRRVGVGFQFFFGRVFVQGGPLLSL